MHGLWKRCLAVLTAAVIAAIVVLVVRKRRGKGCSCSCEGCVYTDTCHQKKDGKLP